MPTAARHAIYHPSEWFRPDQGPRYRQLYRHIAQAISGGALSPDSQLPPERELADMAEVSRVTVRKAVAQLAHDGLIEQRQGAGSFVRPPSAKIDHTLATLTSFTEYMQQRGKTSSSTVIQAVLTQPSPDESVALGVSSLTQVARIDRLRSADGVPMAVERSSLPSDILPDPAQVTTSLYDVLRQRGFAPVHAIQRITAVNLDARDAALLNLPEGSAALRVDRTGYLPSKRPIEFSRGVYRSDIYDFVVELGLEDTP